MAPSYATPTGGASLILSFRLPNKITLILGSGTLAATRAFSALEADSDVVILAKGGINSACEELQWRAQQHQLRVVDWDCLPGSSVSNMFTDTLDAFLDATPTVALAVVTETLSTSQARDLASAEQIYRVFNARNIPVNTTDMPDLCDFSFASSHRFEHHVTGGKTSLQIGVTTNGQGCRLATRLRREIVSKLPLEVGAAVEWVGRMRNLAKEAINVPSDLNFGTAGLGIEQDEITEDEVCEDNGVSTPNRPVPSRSHSETAIETKRRRIKWVAQVSEYWPISKLASMSEEDMKDLLEDVSLHNPAPNSLQSQSIPSLHFQQFPKIGRILLVGSGPGHPSLLTIATNTALTQLADLVLSDKLVPDAVLSLIPKHVQVRIARKFPGNAEGAQLEMMEAAVEAAKQGMTVVRLKQGDPVVYGRAGEEVLYFRAHGFEPLVIPGVSSALAAPTFAGIPVTQRGVAESFIVCTGVGRKGKEVQLPGYERARTLVILMGVARIQQVISALVDISEGKRRDGNAYPSHTPIAIIERASMPDQRVISSTLKDITRALECSGEQRPPGMMIIGWAVLALNGEGDTEVLDEGGEIKDEARVKRWLGEDDSLGWRVWEGIESGWQSL